MTESSQRKSFPRYIILGLVATEPLTGYEIKKWVDCSVRFFWDISYGQIYPTLRQLTQEGMLTMEEKVQKAGPVRKVYTITKTGREELLSWLIY